MASNKNQHFVPRCYLRPFTVDGADAAINLYNIDRQKLIRMAPVKSQCSGDYFYGKDDQLERAIQHLEGEYARGLRAIMEPGYGLTEQHRHLLRLFWLFQHLRTEAASRRAIEMNEGLRKTAGVKDDSFRLEIREAVQIAMRNFAEEMDIVSDLKVCLVRNKTKVPFVTSDDPAILTNRWYMQSPKARGMSFGIGSAGVILILPLSPTVLCLGYDGDVYSIPHKNGWVDIRQQAEAEALNQHQFLNCRANIFVKDANHAQLVHDSFVKAAPLRPAQSHRTHYAVPDRTEGAYTRYVVVDPANAKDHEEALIHTQAVHPIPFAWPHLLTWRNKGAVFSNGTGVGYVRRNRSLRSAEPAFWRENA
jgi:hypothetical protein